MRGLVSLGAGVVAFTNEQGNVTRLVVARADGTGERYVSPPRVNAFDPTWG